MNILFVAQSYHPQLGGIESQTRMVVQTLAARHRVGVAALTLRDDVTPGARDGPRPVPRAVRTIASLSRMLPARMHRKLGGMPARWDTAFPERYASRHDGHVRVHAMIESRRDQSRGLAASLRILAGRGNEMNLRYVAGRQRFLPRLRELVKGMDIVHCVTKKSLACAALEAAREEGIPFVITPYVHPGYGGHDEKSVACCRDADLVFALLETDADHLVELGINRRRIRLSGVSPLLPPTADPAGFRTRLGIGDHPLVLFVGRLVEYKGYRAILEGTSRVWEHMPDVHFAFAGPGDDQSADVFSAHQDARVHHLGVVSEQEKADALAACDVFSMPSHKEILPAVYLEAWSYGKPVIGGLAYGLRELIEGNGGGVVAGHDPDALADATLSLLRDATRRREMGQRGCELVARLYAPEALVGRLEQAYEEALMLGRNRA